MSPGVILSLHIPFPILKAGDQVLLSTDDLPRRNPAISKGFYSRNHLTPALQHRYTGPFTVIERLSNVNYRIALPTSWNAHIHNVFHVSKLRPFVHRDSGLEQ